MPGREPEAEVKPKPAEAAASAPAIGAAAGQGRGRAAGADGAPAVEPRPAASGPVLTRSDVEELRLALTDLAAARRILDRTE